MKTKIFFEAIVVLAVTFFTTTVFAQNCADFKAFPGGEDEGKKMHVLYRDYVEKEQYADAFEMWKQLMEFSPAGHVYHFIDGVTMYKAFIEEAGENEENVKSYTQAIVDLYEQRLACMSPERGDSNTVLETMAYEMSALGYYDTERTLATFEKAVAMNGNKTSAYILAYYADYAIWLYGNDLLGKDKTRAIYQTLEAIKDANADNPDYVDNWVYVEDYYKPYVTYIFDCDYFIKKLKPVYEAAPDNPAVFRDVLEQLLQKSCSKNDAFIRELVVKDSLHILALQDSIINADKDANPDYYGIRLMKNGSEAAAMDYLQIAVAKTDLPADRRANANYYLARIYHGRGGSSNFAKARSYYEAAASLKPGWGEPYYQIGVLYASSGPLCGPGRGWDSQIVLWPAIDMWNKAISTGDAEAAASAKQKINSYTQFLPTTGDGHLRNVKEGSSYTVSCWIQRSTTVRLRNEF